MAWFYSKEDVKIVLRDLGTLLQFLAIGFVLPAIVSAGIHEPATNAVSFLMAGFGCFALGRTLFNGFLVKGETRLKHAMGIVALGLPVFCLLALAPVMWISQSSFSNAFFETMSALTTTGLTVFAPDALARSVVLWRSCLAWIGGMAMVVLALIGVFSAYSRQGIVFKQHVDPQAVKYNFRHCTKQIGKTYAIITLLGVALLLLFGMGPFDAVNYAFNAVSSTGFDTASSGILGFNSRWVEATIVLLSILGATSFFVHYSALNKRLKHSYSQDTQFKALIAIGLVSSALLFPTMAPIANSFKQAVEFSLFQAGTAISNSGFSLAGAVPSISSESGFWLLIVLMLIGGSAASTAGGLKISRVLIAFKSILWKIQSGLDGKKKTAMRFDGRTIDESEVFEINQFIVLFLSCIGIGTVVLVWAGASWSSGLFEAVSAQSNAGFSSGLTNAFMPGISKAVLVILMWIGRLEIIPLFAGVGLLLSAWGHSSAEKKN